MDWAADSFTDPRIHYNGGFAIQHGSSLVSDADKHQHCTNKFIELANQLKDEGIDTSMVSGALMTSSCVYATFVAAGNDGALEASGVDKVVNLYRRTLEHHQEVKRSYLESKIDD